MIDVDPQPVRRDEAMLRVFLLGTVEPEERRANLTKSAAKLEHRLAELRELEKSIEWDDDDLSHYGRLVRNGCGEIRIEIRIRSTEDVVANS
ncbi:hypothetical protein [Nocardia mikamii]|uniref:hypothetical protein n=1 Tax=Nocardia mikamii TaxID=508464 RepID=UPI0007A4A515|nr:hypothetical protein [Nocardia mikamii]